MDPNMAAGLGGGGLGDSLTRLSTAKQMKGGMASGGDAAGAVEASNAAAEQGDYMANPLVQLGPCSVVFMEYATEIEDALNSAGKPVSDLSAESEPDDAMLDAVQEAYDELPAVVQSAMADCYEQPMETIAAAAEKMQEREMIEDAGRFAAFTFIASRLTDFSDDDASLDDDMDLLPEDDEELL